MKLNNKAIAVEFQEDFPVSISQKDAIEAVGSLFELIAQNLEEGHEINIAGFGKFKVTERAARTGRNPATGETIDIPAKKAFKFTPAKALKDRLV